MAAAAAAKVVHRCDTAKETSGGSSGRVRGGPRNMKSMRPPSAAIFFMTYFYRARGGHGPLAPLDPLLETGQLGKALSYFWGQVMSNHDSESEWDFLKIQKENGWPAKKWSPQCMYSYGLVCTDGSGGGLGFFRKSPPPSPY